MIDLVLPVWIEHTTSPLPRECSTTELRQPVPPLRQTREGWRGLGSSIIASAGATRRLRCGPRLRIDERRNGIRLGGPDTSYRHLLPPAAAAALAVHLLP